MLNLAPMFQNHAEQHHMLLHGFGESMGGGHWNEAGRQLAGEIIAQHQCAGVPTADRPAMPGW